MSGLLVDSGYNPIKPNYMKPDTDDELTNVEVPGKQGNPSTSNMCYEKMIFWYKGDQLINMRYAY